MSQDADGGSKDKKKNRVLSYTRVSKLIQTMRNEKEKSRRGPVKGI